MARNLFLVCIFCISFADRTMAAGQEPFSEAAGNLSPLDSPGMADEFVCVNFDQVDIRVMLRTISDITGINFVVDDRIQGTITLISPTRIHIGEIYQVLESILDVKGYAAVPTGEGNLVKIIPKTEAVRHNLQVRIGSDPSDIPRNDSLVTQLIPLSYADAKEVSQLIRPLLATGLHMATYPQTNSILVTDTSSNIHHIAKIIQNLDVPGSEQQVSTIGLKYASAQVLSEQITSIIDKSRATPLHSGQNRPAPAMNGGMKILPDERTNSLIVVADVR